MTEDIEGRKIVVSKALVRDGEGRFLAVRESADRDKETAGKWELPGGRVKVGENRFEAARRELEEEVNLDASEGEDVVRIEVESDHLVSCYIVYFEDFSGEVRLKEEGHHDDFRWVEPEEFVKMDWHSDAGYDIVPMMYLEEYLEKDKIY
jgi:8-oxo-dGTP diphosphatase